MYKIYINETPLILMQNDQIDLQTSVKDETLLIRYNDRLRSLLNSIDMLEKTKRWKTVLIYAPDLEKLFADFSGLYKIIEAAGGVVFNDKNEVLSMYRRGSWDLPKGKIDKGEGKKAAAIREVQEETGLTDLDLGPFLCVTYHTYKTSKKKRVLKKTYWYAMKSTQADLTPQVEEDIETVVWLPVSDFLEKSPLYNTIRLVMEKAESFISS